MIIQVINRHHRSHQVLGHAFHWMFSVDYLSDRSFVPKNDIERVVCLHFMKIPEGPSQSDHFW